MTVVLMIISAILIVGFLAVLAETITRINHAKELERYRSRYSELTRRAMTRPYWMEYQRYTDHSSVENTTTATEINSHNRITVVFNNCNFYLSGIGQAASVTPLPESARRPGLSDGNGAYTSLPLTRGNASCLDDILDAYEKQVQRTPAP